MCQDVSSDNFVISVLSNVVRLPLETLSEVRTFLAVTERKFVVGKMIAIKVVNESRHASRKLFIFQFRLFPNELVVFLN